VSNFITIEQIDGNFVINTNVYPLLTAALAKLKPPIPVANYDNIKQRVTIDPAHSAGEIVKQIEDYLNSNGHTLINGGIYPITFKWL
jgi:hypothetical protein